MNTIKLTTVGNSTGVVLPKEILERLRVSRGDMLHVIETPKGVELTPFDPEFAEQLAIAEEVMRSDRNVLRKLAQQEVADEDVEFMNALDEYKRVSGCMFPTCSEVLRVVRALGYTKHASIVRDREIPVGSRANSQIIGTQYSPNL